MGLEQYRQLCLEYRFAGKMLKPTLSVSEECQQQRNVCRLLAVAQIALWLGLNGMARSLFMRVGRRLGL